MTVGVMDVEALPDYPALRQVQNALWKTGEVHGAAVMIGAGFSRFADRAAETTPEAPLWRDFQEAMLDELYPNGDGPADPLALAEEYRAALGPQALETLIRSRVRDAEWSPGEMHKSLLRLPWADVLTTNWDSLLERSAASDPDLSFEVVRVPADIARARGPRIVKLHGSLPSHGPFIFTEEDFRTYPTRFAPFVNLAQQVLLEKELCLLGFSGDDPNFLEWSGWVRDQLGMSARPIRLVGVLKLSPSRRRLLELRNITPIDLAPLVASTPAEDQHRRATQIFLESLWRARPQTNAEWKLLPTKIDLKSLPDADARLGRIADIWTQDRMSHPGWLVTPHFKRQQLRQNTEWSIGCLRDELGNASVSVSSAVLYEAIWRWETAFWPLPDFLEDAAAQLIADNDDKSLSLSQRVALRLAIVRAARHRGDWSAFDQRLEHLEALSDALAHVAAIYERCLRARDQLDYNFIATNADDIRGQDPVWLMRRAALIAELGEDRTAARLIHEAHQEVRRRRAQDRHSLWLLSREAWTSWLMTSVRFELKDLRIRDEEPDWPLAYKTSDVDPWDEFQHHDSDLARADRDKREAMLERRPPFDAGVYRTASESMRWTSPAIVSPYDELTRLADHVGIPLQLGMIDTLGTRFTRALCSYEEPSVTRTWAAVRAVASDCRGVIDDCFSRSAIARLPLGTVQNVLLQIQGAIVFRKSRTTAIGDDGSTGHHSREVGRVRSLTELLSRLAVRVQGDAAIDLFRLGASLAHDSNITHWWLFESIGNLLRRSLQALEPSRRGEIALDVLRLPLPCEKDISGVDRDWPDVSDSLEKQAWGAREETYAWSSRISFLVNVVAENPNKTSRDYAALRLLKLFEAGALDNDEAGAFGEALWRHTQEDGLPADTSLLPHVFLRLPCPNPGTPPRVFDAAVVKMLAERSFSADRLQALLGASYTLQGQYEPYQLGADDALSIVDHALRWQRREASGRRAFAPYRPEDDWIAEAIGGALASTVLPSLSAPVLGEDRARALLQRASDGSLPPLLKALPALARLDETLLDDVIKAIQTGLIGRDPLVVAAALTAVFWFIRLSSQDGTPVPDALIAETLSICVMRRDPGLVSAFECARLLIDGKVISRLEQRRLADALTLVRAETSYENWLDEPHRSDVGLVRGAAVRLAAALSRAGVEQPILDAWVEEAASDPMPEVRYALLTEEYPN